MGRTLPALLSAPGVTLDNVMLDYMHCIDMGVATDVAGNVLWKCLHAKNLLFTGSNKKVRLKALWEALHAWQLAKKVDHRLTGLTEK